MHTTRGMSLIDVVVGSALVLIVFVALFGLLRTSLLISSSAKIKAGATAIATTQMEYIRSLDYQTVGTIGGIPAGPVPQHATTTMNGIPYGVRTLVQYVDDPRDGTGSADTNRITTDYKRVRVAAYYQFRGEEREVALVSTVSPNGIESTTGGGTLRVQVVNAEGMAVPGAEVHIYNPGLSPSVDVTTFTDSTGAVLFPGAPASADYRVTVTKDGYSTAQTYVRDTTNQNPTPGYLTVAQNQTTTGTFAIDVLASLTVRTFYAEQATTTKDTFATSANVEHMNNVNLAGGAVTLAQDGVGGYLSSGSFRSTPIAPEYLVRWTKAEFALETPSGTGGVVRVLDAEGAPLPDSVLPGNSSGFSSPPITLSGVSTTTYPSLVLSSELTTTATSSTPVVRGWEIASVVGPIPVANVPITLTGQKRKGTTRTGTAIPKTSIATTTDATGIRTLSLEWDVYDLLVGTGFTFATSTPAIPFLVDPGTTSEVHVIVQ